MALGIVMILLGGLVAWLLFDAWRLQGAAQDLESHAAAARDALGLRDVDQVESEIAAVDDAAHAFASAVDGPHWWLAAQIPWVKDQVAPLQAAGTAVEAVADDAIGPLIDVDGLTMLEEPPLEDGRIDPYLLEPYRAPLAVAATTLEDQGQALAEVDLSRSATIVQSAFVDLENQIGALSDLVTAASHAAEVLPGVLGGEGEREYVVMVQNNAEPRATGGIPGAFIQLTVDDGRFTVGRYATEGNLLPDEPIPLTEDEERIFTFRLGYYPQDVNFTPEFPRTAELTAELWAQAYGTRPDGVISIDPVALGWMLGGAEPLDADGTEITSANLSHVMLNRVYFLYEDPSEQDAFFARTSRELFALMLEGPESLLDGVEHAIDDNRLLVWLAEDEAQDLVDETSVAGAFLEDGGALGVFVNDGSGAKIGYYVDTTVTVTDYVCTDGSLDSETVEVSFAHVYDGDPADLPEWVSGGGRYVPEGQFQANLVVYPAVGTEVSGVFRDDEATEAYPDVHDGRPMSQIRVTLDPGEQVTFRYEVDVTAADLGSPRIVQTPGPRDTEPTRLVEAAEGC